MKILQINVDGIVVAKWDSAVKAAKSLGLCTSHIYKVLRGKRFQHGGYVWRYEGEENLTFDFSNTSTFSEKKTSEYSDSKAILTAKTRRSITSKQEALDFFEVDTKVWDVERYIVNSWDVTNRNGKVSTNYQVKLWLKPREVTLEDVLVDINKTLEGYVPKTINISKGSGTITGEFADFHTGANVKDLIRTKDFNVEILSDYLKSSADIINSYNAEKVIINLHGDFFESISGLNHDDSWKSLGAGMYGANIIIFTNELISGSFLSRINNLSGINMVAGNHDRIAAKKSEDLYGEGAKLLAHLLMKDFPKINIDFNSIILSKNIDGINHILTHGDHGISRRDLSKVVFDYGDNKRFNLWTEGHLHSRSVKRTLKTSIAKYDTIDFVTLDEQKYRKVVLPPMFTGNIFSESIGYAGNAGFLITYNNGRGLPIIHDYPL